MERLHGLVHEFDLVVRLLDKHVTECGAQIAASSANVRAHQASVRDVLMEALSDLRAARC